MLFRSTVSQGDLPDDEVTRDTPPSMWLTDDVPPLDSEELIVAATHCKNARKALQIVLATVLYEYNFAPSWNEKSRRYRLVRLVKQFKSDAGVKQVNDVWTTTSRSAVVGKQGNQAPMTVVCRIIERQVQLATPVRTCMSASGTYAAITTPPPAAGGANAQRGQWKK